MCLIQNSDTNSTASAAGHGQKQGTGLSLSYAPCTVLQSFLHSHAADVKHACGICSALIICAPVFESQVLVT